MTKKVEFIATFSFSFRLQKCNRHCSALIRFNSFLLPQKNFNGTVQSEENVATNWAKNMQTFTPNKIPYSIFNILFLIWIEKIFFLLSKATSHKKTWKIEWNQNVFHKFKPQKSPAKILFMFNNSWNNVIKKGLLIGEYIWGNSSSVKSNFSYSWREPLFHRTGETT